MEDDFWAHDIYLFDGIFKYYHNRKQPVRGKVHVSKETYNKRDRLSLEREYLTTGIGRGDRFYVMMKSYVIEPRIIMTVGLHPKPKQYADLGLKVGQTTGSRVEGYRDAEIGNAQAWYYVEDKLLVLWECFPGSRFREKALNKDPFMRLLWEGFERWLLEQFPGTTRIVTPWDDPIWDWESTGDFAELAVFKKASRDSLRNCQIITGKIVYNKLIIYVY